MWAFFTENTLSIGCLVLKKLYKISITERLRVLKALAAWFQKLYKILIIERLGIL